MLRLLVVTLVAAVLLTGCSATPSEPDEPTDASSPSQAPTETPIVRESRPEEMVPNARKLVCSVTKNAFAAPRRALTRSAISTAS